MTDAARSMSSMTPHSASRPDVKGAIGVFDSGVGGLSVLRAIRHELPHENLIYVADSGHAPYGDKPSEHIVRRTLEMGQWLLQCGVRAITVACNTATVVAVRELRQLTQLPVVAIEPAIKPAVALTRNGVVGVLATQQTVQSEGVASLIDRFGQGARIVLQPCPGWVDQVEKGELESAQTLELLRLHTRPLIEAGADVWVLGCTHFPFLLSSLRQLAGPEVQFVDPAQAVARELKRRLESHNSLGTVGRGCEYFYTTGDVTQTQLVTSQLWGQAVHVQSI